MSKLISWLIGLVLVAAIAAVGYSFVAPPGDGQPGASRSAGKGKGKSAGKRGLPRDAVPVTAAVAELMDVPVYLEGLGTARALNTVTVQPLVDGRLLSVDFREGQDIKRGDLLARIDPAIYAAQLAQAEAKLAQDEAQLEDARRELERVSSVGPIATLQKSVDTARAKVAQFEALVKADKASIDLARTQLDYTTVVAPIDGRTGIRMVDQGNVVRASAASAIVVITQVQPIAVLFNLPQQQLARVNAAIATAGAKGAELSAEAIAPDGRTVVDSGVLRVVDNQVDQTTGTIRLKAEFPNAGLALWPGQFISVRLLIDNLRRAVVVPTAAVQQGPKGPFVFVVSDVGTVKMRPVGIALQNERQAAISEGLARGEQVVTSSFSRIREDSAVTVTPAEAPAGPAASTRPAEARKDGEKGRGEGKRGRRREAEGQGGAAGDSRSGAIGEGRAGGAAAITGTTPGSAGTASQ